MMQIAERLRAKEIEMAQERGPFFLFALFLREDAPDVWDLVVSAPWVDTDRPKALSYVAAKVRDALSDPQMAKLSRIVLIDRDNPALAALTQAIQVEHGSIELQDNEFFGMSMRHAYLITSRQDEG